MTGTAQAHPQRADESWSLRHPTPFDPRKLTTDELWFYLTIIGFFSQGVLNTVGEIVSAAIPFLDSTVFTATVIWIPFSLYFFSRVYDRKPLRMLPFVALYSVLIVYLLVTLIVHPENGIAMFDVDWEGNIYPLLFSPIAPVVAFMVVTAAPHLDIVLHGLRHAAYLTFAGNFVRLGQATAQGSWSTENSRGQEIEISYNLGFGYSVLFCVVVFLFFAFAGQRVVLHSLGVIAGLYMIFTNGSRAPLGIAFAALAMLMIYFFGRLFFKSPLRLTGFVLLVTVTAAVAMNIDRVLRTLQTLFATVGIESRTFDRLLSGSLAEDPARDTLAQMSDQLIATGGAFGHGLFGDRQVIRQRFRWGYPHNIVDEFMVTYGLLGGAIIIIGLVSFVLAALIKSRRTIYCDLIVLLIPMNFQLWVSMSYLMSIWFWALLGACWLGLFAPRRNSVQGTKRSNGGTTSSLLRAQRRSALAR